MIVPYRGFGRGHELLIRGRVLRPKKITPAAEGERVLRSLLNAWRRFESDELPNMKVRCAYRDVVVETVTDDEGHFQARLAPQIIDPGKLWHQVDLSMQDGKIAAVGYVQVPSADAEFGIISDIDDTIVQTGATSLVQMIRSVMQNARARLPFEGVAELYAALHRDRNPLFYVSSSPWNLYDVLDEYKALNKIPPGPMFLQDYGWDEDTFIHDAHDVHKLREINTILEFYPDLPFILIGDSGQRDPEIYLQVIQAHPSRVRAIFIRDVTADVRDKTVAKIANDVQALGVPMHYVANSKEALEIARKTGLA